MKNDLSVVDVNAWLGPWPFQYFHDDTARLLEHRLSAEGITRALVGSPEAALNPDCMETNRLLLKRLAGSRMLSPVPALDPTKGDWVDILTLCGDEGAGAVRLFPGYHVYELSSPAALTAIERIAAEKSLALFVQMRMEDERTHHPLCLIPGVSVSSILETAARFPTLKVVALCPYYHEAVELGKGPSNILFDISHLETLRTLSSLVRDVPKERVLFGSHVPFLQSRAALMKLDAPYVTDEVRLAIGSGNAARALPGALQTRPPAKRTPVRKRAPATRRKPSRAGARGRR